ncbi:hypothetical protein [Actinoplanes xinjiangensis]|uniref:PT repeat-containing protein n=1 Tax=Actinoplanes xinjiangensis TaxID=512350 RepID=A0A316FBM9_9ACTN|nr:hypothetical protein [Actinoplanes xinjiangensis]PWK46291.1 hypothetical protein BC793_110285 [Actinoplanes xinjiangensis]GIF40771.1 hypothetical protein Axi01nite_50820 [Actinoplanes xinjiangensis]
MSPALRFSGLAFMLALTAGSVAACADKEATVPPNAGSSQGGADEGVTFAKCMRDEGVDIPDPAPGSPVLLPAQGPGEEGSASAKKMAAALEKCRQYMPNGGKADKPDPEYTEQLRAFAKCMRENGAPDFPDPDPETGRLNSPGKGLTVDENMGKIMEKCKLPDGAAVPPVIGSAK